MQKKRVVSLIAAVFAAAAFANAQDTAAIQKQLEAQYALTQPTDDRTDIVTPGAVLVLKKDKLTTVVVSSKMIYAISTYKDGKINLNGAAKTDSIFKKCPRFLPCPQVQTPETPTTRVFVKNEKMWVTKITVNPEKATFELFTDAYGDNRFKGSLNFPFPRGASADDVLKLVAEVFTVDAGDDQKSNTKDQKSAAVQEAPSAPAVSAGDPPAVVAPPPPAPSDAPSAPPKTTKLGQNTDEVVANLGQPDSIDKKGKAQVYVYQKLGLKVTFTGGKLTDIQ